MKKTLLLIMAMTLVVSLGLSTVSDAAKRGGFGGGYKSPKRSYTETPAKPADNVKKAEPGKTTKAPGAATPATNRGFLSGGGFARGLMIGGFAGLLFGGMFANMGAFGNLLGLIVNLFFLYLIFIALRGIIRYFRNPNKSNPHDPYRR